MSAQVKICGLNSRSAVEAAAHADFAGFVFFAKSPRFVSPSHAQALAANLPRRVIRVALMVDPSDDMLDQSLALFDADLLQLHGHETPDRVQEIRTRTRLPVLKAVGISSAADLTVARSYENIADGLLFDAKPPARPDALPGGNAVSFDWSLLAGQSWAKPWMLSGGLTPANVATALQITRAPAVDVSSGVEIRPGRKSPRMIRRFLSAVAGA